VIIGSATLIPHASVKVGADAPCPDSERTALFPCPTMPFPDFGLPTTFFQSHLLLQNTLWNYSPCSKPSSDDLLTIRIEVPGFRRTINDH
jgi:hypothetical protein